MIQNISALKRYGTLVSAICLFIVGLIISQAGVWAIDHWSFEHATIIYSRGNLLEIEIDREIDTGSDSGYAMCAQVIRNITNAGYIVKWNGQTYDGLDAEILVMLSGAPVPIQTFKLIKDAIYLYQGEIDFMPDTMAEVYLNFLDN